MEDLGALNDRVRNLQNHFGQANEDIEQILISTGRSRSAPPRSRISNSTTIAQEPRSSRRRSASSGGRVSVLVIPGREQASAARIILRRCEPSESPVDDRRARPAPRHDSDWHRAAAPVLLRRARGLSQAARADRAVPRLLVGAAAGAVGHDAAGVDARGRRRSRHHRPVRAWSARPTP